MHVPHPDFEEIFKVRFPYPMPRYTYSEEAYARISKLSKRWRWLHLVIGTVLWIVFMTALMFILCWLTAQFYTTLDTDKVKMFPPHEIMFLLPAMAVSLPLGILAALKLISYYHPADHKDIMDLLNTRLEYDSIKGWKWTIKGLAIFTLLGSAFAAWTHVSVSDSGIDVKRPTAFGYTHYNYSDLAYVRQFHNGHRDIILIDGRSFHSIAVYAQVKDCISYILGKVDLPVVEADNSKAK